jgi:uncharacterized membrane protein
VSDEKKITLGGNIDVTLRGETNVELASCAKEGWLLSKANRGALIQGSLFTLSMSLLLIFVIQIWFDVEDLQNVSIQVSFLLNVLFTLLTAPLLTALMVMGIRQSVGEGSVFINLAKQLSTSALLIFTALMIGALVNLGMSILLVPGIYLSMSMAFALPLLADKKLRPSEAILLSVQVFNRYWRTLAMFYLAAFVLFMAGLFTLGLAYFWIVPWYFNTKGVLYRELFGVEVISSGQTTAGHKDEKVFYA